MASDSENPAPPLFTAVHHLNFSVNDADRSADWYEDVLGLERGWEATNPDGTGRKIALLVPDSPLRVVLTQHDAPEGGPFSEFRTGLDHVAFTVEDRRALEAWVRHLAEKGVACSPIKEGATGYLITFRDPDNIQMEMYTRGKE